MTHSNHTFQFQRKQSLNDEKGLVVRFLFECNVKNKNSHEVSFYLSENLANECALNYAKYVTTTNNQQLHSDESSNETAAKSDTSIKNKNFNETDLNQKISILIEQVNKLTQLLTEQQEENAKLK